MVFRFTGRMLQRIGGAALRDVQGGAGTSLILPEDGNAETLDRLCPRGWIDGMILSNNGLDSIDISAGVARSGDNLKTLQLSALTRDLTGAFGTGNGGLSSSLTYSANTWYHAFALLDSGGSDNIACDTSVTAANLITDHGASNVRRIGAVLTDGSANIIGFSQVGDEFLWDTIVDDVDVTNPGTTRVTRTLASVPTGVKVLAQIAFLGIDSAGSARSTNHLVTSLDQSDTAPAVDTCDFNLFGSGNPYGSVHRTVRTNTSAQIGTRMTGTSDASIRQVVVVHGWIDPRGRNA